MDNTVAHAAAYRGNSRLGFMSHNGFCTPPRAREAEQTVTDRLANTNNGQCAQHY